MPSGYLEKLAPEVLQDFADAIVIVNLKTCKILDVNLKATNMFGYTRKAMLGMSVFKIHSLGDKQYIEGLLKKIGLAKSEYYCDIPCVHADGHIFVVDIACRVLKHTGGMIATGFFRERCKLKEETTSWSSIYQHLAESIGYGMCLAANHKIIYANQAFTDMIGATSSLEVIGRKLIDIVPPVCHEKFRKDYENAISGITSVLTMKCQVMKFDRSEITVHLRASRIMLHGEWALQLLFSNPHNGPQRIFTNGDLSRMKDMPWVKSLTKREIEILCLLCKGNTGKEIAHKLNISVRTVAAHKRNVMCKLGIHNIAELISSAIRNNVFNLDE